MATLRQYVPLKQTLARRVEQLFEVTEARTQPPMRKAQLASIEHPEWVRPELLAFARELNGFVLAWKTKVDQAPGTGRVHVLPIEQMYGDWRGVVYDEHTTDARLRHFKIVDYFANEACVGLFHEARQDPGLYYYEFANQAFPLRLDLKGYLTMLTQALGYAHWQQVLLDLAPAKRRPKGGVTRQFRRDLAAWDPAFNFDEFVGLYESVRLPA